MKNINLEVALHRVTNAKKTLFILCGLPYSGKSYIANRVCSQADIQYVSIDHIFHERGFDWTTNRLPNTDEWKNIFSISYEQTKSALEAGKNVLYDSTNQTVGSRNALRDVAASVAADACVLFVKVSSDTIWERWEKSRTNQDRPTIPKELVYQTINEFEEPAEAEQVIIINN